MFLSNFHRLFFVQAPPRRRQADGDAPPPRNKTSPRRCPADLFPPNSDGLSNITTPSNLSKTKSALPVLTLLLLILLAFCGPVRAQISWQDAFAQMPLREPVTELDRQNCVRVMLASFQRNPAVKALIFMPGATDEFYFFHRARAKLTNAAPTLLDAVIALTNQTYIRAALCRPFLLLHGVEDPLTPLFAIGDPKTAARIQRRKFDRHGIFNDVDWPNMEPKIAFCADTIMEPPPDSHNAWHFFRNSFAEYDLTAWEALEAVAMASKTQFVVKHKLVVFEGDDRPMPKPIPPDPSIFRWK